MSQLGQNRTAALAAFGCGLALARDDLMFTLSLPPLAQ